MNKKNTPFWLLLLSVILFLIVSQLIQDGMFMDGMLYVSVAKNLADGLGTFWNPHFSPTAYPSFHEQPPLYFGLLSIFYKVFGTSMYIERLFCLSCFTVTALYINAIWRKIYSADSQIAALGWLPIIFWCTIPVCFWAYSNHVEETVMSVFVIASVYHLYQSLFLEKKIYLNLIIAGIFIFLASLTKGFQGIFPLVGIGLYWIITRKISFRKTFFYSLILFSIPSILYLLAIASNPEVYLSYSKYFSKRLVGTFNNVGATTNNHFDIIIRLFTELIPVFIVCLLAYFFGKKNLNNDRRLFENDKIYWFISLGLCGALPLAITLEQRGFYLTTALPCFAIAFSILIAPYLSPMLDKIDVHSGKFKTFSTLSFLVLFSSVVFVISNINNTKRDKEMLHDVYLMHQFMPRGEIIGIPEEMWDEWSLHEYLVRYGYISLYVSQKQKYFILKKDMPSTLVPKGYHQLQVKTWSVNIYERNDQ